MARQWHFILALFLFPAVYSLDFGGTRVSRTAHSLHMNAAGKIRSAVESSHQHTIKKRSADDGGDTCKGLQGYNDKLSNNTHIVSLNRLFQLLPTRLSFNLCFLPNSLVRLFDFQLLCSNNTLMY